MEKRSPLVAARSALRFILGIGALVAGFISIIFASPPRSFNVSIGDYDSDEVGVAHADVPYSQSAYGCGSCSSCSSCTDGGCSSCGEGEGCGDGCGEGEGK